MQPEEIRKGLNTLLMGATNNFKTAIGSELYFGQNPRKPADVIYPYVVYYFIGGELDRDSATKYEKPVVRFTIYDNSVSQTKIFEIAEKLDNQLDDKEASAIMTGFKVLSIDRITPITDAALNENDNWFLPINYRIHLQRT